MSQKLSYFLILCITLLLFVPGVVAFSQTINGDIKTISGQVLDENKKALPFVNIYVEGSTHGVTSNMEGNFVLDIEKTQNCNLVFQYVGYKKQIVSISSADNPSPLEITLEIENILLGEVVISANKEDPAYPIIREAIKKRKFHLDQVQSFSAKMYMKSNIELDEIPEKLFLVPKDEMPDSTDLGLVYLSESVSRYHFEKPDYQKEEMIASKVAGEKTGFSFNRADMIMLNFYKNLISVGISERAFISPIAGNAMFYYKYRLVESFMDKEVMVHKIQVIPKRKHDNVFSGYIYIVEKDWNIHSLDLTIHRHSQIDFTDSIYIRQVHVPVNESIRMPLSLHIVMYFKVFGFKASTDFIGFFSEYEVNKEFPEKFFSHEVFKVEKESSKRDSVFWDKSRQAVLTDEEIKNYHEGDIILKVRQSKAYQDSVNKINNVFKPKDLLWSGGYYYRNRFKRTSYHLHPLLKGLMNFNTVEGWFLFTDQRFTKRWENRNLLYLDLLTKYSFTNKNLYYRPKITYLFDRINSQYLIFEGGLNSFQYNQSNPIASSINTYYTLFAKDNFAKFFEKKFLKLSYGREIINGLNVSSSIEYARRSPLVNQSDYSFRKLPDKEFTSNNPLNPTDDSPAFTTNKAFIWALDLTIKFGQKFATYPTHKERYGSKYPIIRLGYRKAFATSFTDADYDRWFVRVNDKIGLKNLGVSNFTAELGGFFNTSKMDFMDYKHFNGNQTLFILQPGMNEISIGGEGNNYSENKVITFHALNYYSNSTNGNYAAFNYTHHFNGWIINKIPLLRNTKIQTLAGVNFLYTPEKKEYTEFYLGFEHIFKMLRLDFVSKYYKGQKLIPELRIGVGF